MNRLYLYAIVPAASARRSMSPVYGRPSRRYGSFAATRLPPSSAQLLQSTSVPCRARTPFVTCWRMNRSWNA